jgi:hypothetical protein
VALACSWLQFAGDRDASTSGGDGAARGRVLALQLQEAARGRSFNSRG